MAGYKRLPRSRPRGKPGCALSPFWFVIICLVAFAFVGGCGSTPLRTNAAQTADIVTTGIGISAGLTEANPIVAPLAASPGGLVVLLLLRYQVTEMVKKDQAALATYETVGWSAAAWNLSVIY